MSARDYWLARVEIPNQMPMDRAARRILFDAGMLSDPMDERVARWAWAIALDLPTTELDRVLILKWARTLSGEARDALLVLMNLTNKAEAREAILRMREELRCAGT